MLHSYHGNRPFLIGNDCDPVKGKYTLAVNAEKTICLSSNPSTGFKWFLVRSTKAAVVDSVSWNYTASRPGLPGSGGKEYWTFRGMKRGRDTVTLIYMRRWDPGSVIETRKIVFFVK